MTAASRRGGLAAVALAAALALLAAGCGWSQPDRIRVSAVFPDGVGLYEGNAVAVLGIPVGTVVAVHPAGTHVVVDLALDPDTRIPADVGAVTLSPSVVTDRRVELTPPYRGGPTLRDGDLIPLERTRTPVEIDRVFEAADRLAGQLNTVLDHGGRPALADALDVGARDFVGNGDKFREALRGLAASVGVGADNRDQLMSLIREADRLTRVSADQDATIRSFTANLDDATALMDQQGPHLVESLRNITELLERTDRLISQNRADGEDTLRNLRASATTLANHSRELSESADVLPTAFLNLTDIVDQKQRFARVHVSFEQPTLDIQLTGDLCRQYAPLLCAPRDGRMSSDFAGLARMFAGVGR